MEVEALVDVLEALGRHRLDADERALDARLAHGVEELGILGRFHGDLREEDHVARQLRELLHQLEPLLPDVLELVQTALVLPAPRHGQIAQRHGIEVVVGQGDEPEPAPAQLDDFVDDGLDVARLRGSWPSVRQTEQNEQCFGQPRTVCTDAHM